MQAHRRWLLKAQEDLSFARLGFREGGPTPQACCLCQQAVEKSLKGWLIFKGKLYPKTHSLEHLAALSEELKSHLEGLQEDIRLLDQLYVPLRYPDAPSGALPEGAPTHNQTLRILDITEKIIRIVEKAIPPQRAIADS